MATKFSQELFDGICERIADGESLRSICAAKDMPSKGAFLLWVSKDDALADHYTRAREIQADTIFDEVLDIADDATNDWMQQNGDDGEAYKLNGEHVQRSRLRIDARKWMAGKLRPKKYGDKLDLNHGGALSVTLESDVSKL
jgi:hypothetical protein